MQQNPIEDMHTAAAIFDKAAALHRTSDHGQSGTPRSQLVTDRLVSYLEL